MLLLLIQVREALLFMILLFIFIKDASKIRSGMSFEIDDSKSSLDTMEGPEKEVEELQEKIALEYTELITKRDLKGTLN